MNIKKTLKTIGLILFLLVLVGCGSSNLKGKGTAQIFLFDVNTYEHVGEPIIKEGPMGKIESVPIPKVDGYVFFGLEEFLTIEYTDDYGHYYPLSYMKLGDIQPNQGRVVFMFVDATNHLIMDTVEIVGEIGTNQEYVNEFTLEWFKLVDSSQNKITVVFEGDVQVIKINYVEKTDEDYEYSYTVNYLEKTTDKVLHNKLVGTNHIGIVNLEPHPEIKGYTRLTEETTISITHNEYTNILNVYYVKDDSEWATIKFVGGENTTAIETTFDVIKNHPFNGKNQPTINPPDIIAALGYKSAGWLPTFEVDGEVTEDKTFVAQAIVNENIEFDYVVNYLEETTDKVLHTKLTGTNHIGIVNLETHPEIKGYTRLTEETMISITNNKDTNVLNVYYVKNDLEWATIKFVGGENTTVIETTFDVIKNHPFNGENQPTINLPWININYGYKSAGWLPTFEIDGEVTEDKTFVAQAIVNKNIEFDYVVNYLEETTDKVLHTKLTISSYITTINLESHPEIKGYTRLTEETMISITNNKDTNVLNVYYVKNDLEWATIKFVGGENTTVIEMTFDVIKNHPFNGENQPTITPPEITAAPGYKSAGWLPTFEIDGEVIEDKTFVAQVEIDALQWTTIKFTAGANSTVTETTFNVIKNHPFDGINQPTITPPEITAAPGYKSVGWSPVFESNGKVRSEKTFVAKVEIDPLQWVTIKFTAGENSTVTEKTFNVIKNHPFDGINQPTITPPEITAAPGYKSAGWLPVFLADGQVEGGETFVAQVEIDPLQWATIKFTAGENSTVTETTFNVIINHPFNGTNQPTITPPEITAAPGYKSAGWSPIFSDKGRVSGEETFVAQVEIDPLQWVTIKFVRAQNSTVTETTFNVIKNHPFDGTNQPTINPPDITPATGYMINPEGAWSPMFEPDGQVEGPQTFTAQVVPDPEYWRYVTIRHIGQDLNGEYNTELHVDIIYAMINTNVHAHRYYNFEGFTFGYAPTHLVTSEENQELIAPYYRNRNAIYISPNGGHPGSNSITNIYYGEEVVDVFYLSNGEPTRAGYELTGWEIHLPTGYTGQLLGPGYKMPNSYLYLKAHWVGNPYTIAFDPNGADEGDVMPNQAAVNGENITLSKNIYVKEGYRFVGWSTESDGEVEYTDEQEVSDLIESGEIILYAVWKQEYEINLNLNGGELPSGHSEISYFIDSEFPYILPRLTKTEGEADLEFLGWYTTNDTTGTKYNVLGAVMQNYTLYAIWGDECYYRGEYPQSQISDTLLIAELDMITPEVSSKLLTTSGVETYTEEWKTVIYGDYKFEKVGEKYYMYEPIAFCKLTEGGTFYSKYVIDFSPFDNGQENSNNYDNSYVKKYLNEVLKTKAGLTSTLGLLSKEQLENPNNFADDNSRLATQTDYARVIVYPQPNIRSNIPWAGGGYYYLNYYWTKTPVSTQSSRVFTVVWTGGFGGNYGNGTDAVIGLRFTIED